MDSPIRLNCKHTQKNLKYITRDLSCCLSRCVGGVSRKACVWHQPVCEREGGWKPLSVGSRARELYANSQPRYTVWCPVGQGECSVGQQQFGPA